MGTRLTKYNLQNYGKVVEKDRRKLIVMKARIYENVLDLGKNILK